MNKLQQKTVYLIGEQCTANNVTEQSQNNKDILKPYVNACWKPSVFEIKQNVQETKRNG